MMTENMITLRTGVQVPTEAFNRITGSMKELTKKGHHGILALTNLIKLCQDPSHKLPKKEGDMLKNAKLINDDGTAPEHVKHITLDPRLNEWI